jgi:hypothetical protein
MAASVKRFEAVLETGGQSLGWTIARVPFDPHVAWKQMVRLRVCGTIRGTEGMGPGGEAAFRTSLFHDARAGDGNGDYHLLVNKAMQRGAGVSVGQMAAFTLQPDMAPRPAELPDELAVLLEEEPGLRDWYDSLSENTRRQIGTYLAEPKSDEARMKRTEQMAERMLGTMEAERELPPAIAAAFRQRPKAKAGWQKMTPTQRRMELFAVEAYKSVESRRKRIEKLCDAAEKKVG